MGWPCCTASIVPGGLGSRAAKKSRLWVVAASAISCAMLISRKSITLLPAAGSTAGAGMAAGGGPAVSVASGDVGWCRVVPGGGGGVVGVVGGVCCHRLQQPGAAQPEAASAR